jgi:hypothetical protein
MTDINSVLDNATQWTTEGVTKPSILTGQLHNINMMGRGIVTTRVSSEDQLIGVMERNAYSVNSIEMWTCDMVSNISYADLENMVGVVKRIIAEYGQVAGEETYLNWDGGEFYIFNNVRFEFHFVILRNKALQTEF